MPKTKSNVTAATRAARAAREARARQIQTWLGVAIVGGAVVGAYVLTLKHQLHPAAAVGLTLLALFRGYVLRRELLRQTRAE